MYRVAEDANPAAHRLVLALLLALVLHLTLLLTVPLDWRIFQIPAPRRFEVVLLPPAAPPMIEQPVAAAEIVDLPEPEPSRLESVLAAPPPTPVIADPPPSPVPVPVLPVPRPVVQTAQPVQPQPVAPPKPPKPFVKPAVRSPEKPAAQPQIKPRLTLPPLPKPAKPATQPAASAASRPVKRPTTRDNRTGSAVHPPARLDRATLLSQVAGIEAENQRRETTGIRSKRVSPADTQSAEGFYIAAWVRKVEQIGAMNFPAVARQLNLNTGPTLEVAIRADGSLQEVRIARSSGHAELDQAAQQIVRLGAPYAPFPPQVRQRYDVLYIARPWRFDPGGRVQAR